MHSQLGQVNGGHVPANSILIQKADGIRNQIYTLVPLGVPEFVFGKGENPATKQVSVAVAYTIGK